MKVPSMTKTIKKRIMVIADSPNPKDYDTLAKTINENLEYPLFDTEEHLESQFAILARLFEREV